MTLFFHLVTRPDVVECQIFFVLFCFYWACNLKLRTRTLFSAFISIVHPNLFHSYRHSSTVQAGNTKTVPSAAWSHGQPRWFISMGWLVSLEFDGAWGRRPLAHGAPLQRPWGRILQILHVRACALGRTSTLRCGDRWAFNLGTSHAFQLHFSKS